MKTLIALSLSAIVAATVLSNPPAQATAPAKATKSFGIYFYETQKSFGDRTGAAAPKYWEKWMGYIGKIQASGVIESGSALLPPTTGVVLDGKGKRALNASTVNLSGYLIVKAESLDAAVSIANTCPAIQDGGRVEVRELLPMNQDMEKGK